MRKTDAIPSKAPPRKVTASPAASVRAAERRQAIRARAKALETLAGTVDRALSLGAYNAAADTRLMEKIKSGTKWSPDRALSEDRARLVQFSRAMDLNNAPARAVVSRMVDLVVGHEIQPRAAADSPAYEAVALWLETRDEMDARGIESQGELQRQVLREWLVAGDLGVALIGQGLPEDARAPRLQLIEAERIGDPRRTRMSKAAAGEKTAAASTVEGVELDTSGRPLAYWVSDWDAFGGSAIANPRKIDATSFLMPACRQRAGQTRGAPYLSAALVRLAMLEEYHTAVQTAASLHAMFAAIITTNSPQAVRTVLKSGTETKAGSGEDSGSSRVTDLMATPTGSVMVLGPGEDMKGMQGSQPVANFDGYNQAVLRLVCAAAGLPVEVALLDVSRANFSVSRMAELMSQNTAEVVRRSLVHQFIRPVWRFFIDWQIAKGKLKEANRADYLGVTWHAPPRKMIDPQIETDTALAQIGANLISKDDYIESQGGDPDAVRADRARERREEERLNIVPVDEKPERFSADVPAPGGKAPPPQDPPADPNTDPQEGA